MQDKRLGQPRTCHLSLAPAADVQLWQMLGSRPQAGRHPALHAQGLCGKHRLSHCLPAAPPQCLGISRPQPSHLGWGTARLTWAWQMFLPLLCSACLSAPLMFPWCPNVSFYNIIGNTFLEPIILSNIFQRTMEKNPWCTELTAFVLLWAKQTQKEGVRRKKTGKLMLRPKLVQNYLWQTHRPSREKMEETLWPQLLLDNVFICSLMK